MSGIVARRGMAGEHARQECLLLVKATPIHACRRCLGRNVKVDAAAAWGGGTGRSMSHGKGTHLAMPPCDWSRMTLKPQLRPYRLPSWVLATASKGLTCQRSMHSVTMFYYWTLHYVLITVCIISASKARL